MDGVAVADERESATFDGFVAARGDALWRSAWLLVGDAHLAEDLVQTALAKSYGAWAPDRGPRGIRGVRAARPLHDVHLVVATPLER